MANKAAQIDTIPEEALALGKQLCFAVYSAAHAFNRAYKPLLDRFGLTYPQYLVLLALWQQDEMTVKRIGEEVGLPLHVYPLEQTADAHRAVEHGAVGKVLVDVTA